jgi:crotonobetaine/carnitine-CoA ligase
MMVSRRDADAASTLPAVLAVNAERDPDGLFLSYNHDRLSWSQTWQGARAMSVGFHGLGVRRGDSVAVVLDNRREFIETWFGLATLGAVEVPINPAVTGARLARVLNHSRAAWAVVQATVAAELDALAGDLPYLRHVVVVDAGGTERFNYSPHSGLFGSDSGYLDHAVNVADPVAVMYTSGSSGPAKGVVVPHGQHRTNGMQAVDAAGITADDILFCCLPLHHNMAQGYAVWPALLSGASLTLAPRFDRRTFWREVASAQATVVPFVGGMLALLAAEPPADSDRLNSLRVGYGVPVPAALHEPFERRFDVELIQGYGSTEATIPTWNVKPDRVIGSVGKVVPGFEVAVFDDSDRPLPPDSPGEIRVRATSPNTMFAEYYREPVSTAKAWRGGWFRTGDRGCLDPSGHLFFKGRAGDAIRRFGEFIDPEQVEEAAAAHPSVGAAAAFGVASAVSEQDVMLSVVPSDGADVVAEVLREWLSTQLPQYAIPRYIDVVDELPMTPTGKVERFRLRERGVTAQTFDSRSLNRSTK